MIRNNLFPEPTKESTYLHMFLWLTRLINYFSYRAVSIEVESSNAISFITYILLSTKENKHRNYENWWKKYPLISNRNRINLLRERTRKIIPKPPAPILLSTVYWPTVSPSSPRIPCELSRLFSYKNFGLHATGFNVTTFPLDIGGYDKFLY